MSVSHNPYQILSKYLVNQVAGLKSKSVRDKIIFTLLWTYPQGENDEKRDISDRTKRSSAFNFGNFAMKFYIHYHETL